MAKRAYGAMRAGMELKSGDTETRLGMEALLSALEDWRRAQEAFDSADDPVILELASIKLEAAHRRFGCLAAELGRK